MGSEAIKFDEYLANNLEKRFEFLYENYSIMKILIKDYKEDVFYSSYSIFHFHFTFISEIRF